MDSNIISRVLIGLILVTIVSSSYFYNLDYFLLLILITFVAYDTYKIKVANKSILIASFFIFSLIFFIPLEIIGNIFILEVILIIFIVLFHKFKQIFFLISLYIFIIILFYIIETDRHLFYVLIFVSFFNDSIAYLSGRSIGGPKIAPIISPKKTWSGSLISFFATTLVLYYLNFDILLSMLISMSFFSGDIFFSYIKRYMQIKDFSNSLGGHGGILDRIDSMFFVAVIFQIYLVL